MVTDQFQLVCLSCDRPMLADPESCGSQVICPYCHSSLRVPEEAGHGGPVRAERPSTAPKRVFNFPCPRCECLLEAHTGMINQSGKCPNCAARFIVPALRGSMPRPAEMLEEGPPDEERAALHAYGASGAQAPQIVTLPNGAPAIRCPRCEKYNQIDAELCNECQAPFTMESAPSVAASAADRYAAAAVIVGIVSIVLFPAILPALLAVGLGCRAVFAPVQRRNSAGALVGIGLGLLSLLLATAWYLAL